MLLNDLTHLLQLLSEVLFHFPFTDDKTEVQRTQKKYHPVSFRARIGNSVSWLIKAKYYPWLGSTAVESRNHPEASDS